MLLQENIANLPLRRAIVRVVGKFRLELLSGRIPHGETPVGTAEFVVGAGPLRGHVHSFLILDQRSIEIFHAFHNLAGNFVHQN